MLGTIASIVLVSIGAAVSMVIVAYGIYITFYPFARTVGGGFQVMKYYYNKQRAKAFQRDYAFVHDAQLGFTMADGGDRIKKKSRKSKR
jgi:hypothetical protein